MLTLKKNGLLYKSKWIYNKELGEGSYVESDVTAIPALHLFNECKLEDGVTLRDLFLFVKRHIEFFDLIVTNWCAEIVDEGLSSISSTHEREKEIEYLEVYKLLTIEENETDGMTRADFHGVGYANEKDERINWGVSLSSSNVLIDLPLKLNTTCEVYKNHEIKPYLTLPNIAFTLIEIIYGIIWELSFFGGPQERQEKKNELDAMVDDLELEQEQEES